MKQLVRHRSSLHSIGVLRALFFVALGLAAGCGRGPNVESIDPPANARGVVAGKILLQSQTAGPGVVVTLERVEAGVSASVRRALAGATTEGAGARSRPSIESAAADIRATVTDPSGRFAFDHVPPGSYLVTGSTRHYQAGFERIDLPTTSADTTYVNIHLLPTGTFAGNATLVAESNHAETVVYVEGTSYVAVTDDAGDWLLTDVPIGTYTIRAMHPRFLSRSVAGTLGFAGDSVVVAPMLLPPNTNILPVARVSTSAPACEGSPVNFTVTASDTDGTVVRYEWDFDDDGTFDYTSTVTGNTSHTYALGTYLARLRVTDNDGGWGVSVIPVSISGQSVFYVSASAPGGGNGSQASPFNTIAAALSAASSPGPCPAFIRVSNETYNESPVFVGGVETLGGYDKTTWTRPSGSYTIVNVGTTAARATSITTATRINGFDFRATNQSAPGANSIALHVVSSNSNLLFEDCKFTSARGGDGNAAGSGTGGTPGGPGGTGSGMSGGSAGASGSPGGGAGGVGGDGGLGANGVTENGRAGGSALGGCGTGGAGGAAATGCPGSGGNGVSGGAGCAGGNGANGMLITNPGTVSGGVFITSPGFNGSDGTGGLAGGGGGGGGGPQYQPPICQGGWGGSGGGGGGGGGYGTKGFGGQGGGSSFAVYLYASSARFTACTFTSGAGATGGAGGNGGAGANGGSGGSAGTPNNSGGLGGLGGAGMAGGGGGGGGGGAGGSTVCVAHAAGSTLLITSPTYLVGASGSGGPGGLRGGVGPAAPTGRVGSAASTLALTGSTPNIALRQSQKR